MVDFDQSDGLMYIESISAAYFLITSFLFSFRVGVSNPFSTVNYSGIK